ncbi:hypothetical protein [Cobetia sp. 29-18-1]|uniref:DUF6957 family protein n=1 Tax=Cobetia sp. 29-18-1 TaxID=3040018 RepID=UPI00244D2B05|nr:hypothetical protein [Cobetia sp. 29-18-1]MDH2299487.1 hypothetical protein [Cobetia sp. 29-18-1]
MTNNRQPYDCSVKDWLIISVDDNEVKGRYLYGIVVLDKTGRFDKDDYVFTSPILSIDEESSIVKTQNNNYQVLGQGKYVTYNFPQAILLKQFGVLS